MVNLPKKALNSETLEEKHQEEQEEERKVNVEYICYYCGWVRAQSVNQHEHSLDHRLKASGLKKCGLLRVGPMVWNPDHLGYHVLLNNFEKKFGGVHDTFLMRSKH